MGPPRPQCGHNCTYNPRISTEAEGMTMQGNLAVIATAISNIYHFMIQHFSLYDSSKEYK